MQDELWVLEWHHRSNSLHVQPIARTVEVNLKKLHANEDPGAWAPIFVGTKAEVDEAADRVRPILIERERGRVTA